MDDSVIIKFRNYIEKFVKKDKINHAYLIETNYNDKIGLANEFVNYLLAFDDNITFDDLEKKYDLTVITSDNNMIKTEDIENLKKKYITKSITGNRRIYIIDGAEKMNDFASNKLLKFLEEPEGDILAILLTENRNKVFETIVSRCQVLRFMTSDVQNFDEDIINLTFDFVLNIEENKEKAIAFQNRFDIKKITDRNILQEFLNNLMYIYDDVLNYKYTKKINIFDSRENEIIRISDLNSLNNIENKVKAINLSISRLKYNSNIKLLIDKLIIEMSGVDTNV